MQLIQAGRASIENTENDKPPVELAFRPLQRRDLPLLQGWLSAPHVVEWWRQPPDLLGVFAKYVPSINGTEPTHVFIIEGDARPVGWIQWYRWADYPKHAALLGAEPSAAGLDLAIGEAQLLGRGLGPAAIRAFVESTVFADPAITACVCDPELNNTRSRRAFEKAGFAVMHMTRLPGEGFARIVMRRERFR